MRRRATPEGREKEKARKRQWVASWTPERKAAERARSRAKPRTAENQMLHSARGRAKEAGVECTITAADIVIPTQCPWLGIPLGKRTDGKKHDGSPSLDRIIPEIGYVRGNVIVVSMLANRIKNSGTPEQVAAVARGLRSVYPQWLLID